MSVPLLFRRLLVYGSLAAASPAILFGQENLSPQGVEYSIVGALLGDQVRPEVAIDASGGYLVWEDNSIRTNGLRIRAEHLDSGLVPDGLPFSVSSAVASKTAGEQEKPHVALLSNGGAVIVWQGGRPGFQQIYARFLSSTGAFTTTSDIRVGAHAKNNQINPAVASLANGMVVVVWASFDQDGSYQGVFAQRFSPVGAKIGVEFRINQYTLLSQRTPSIAPLTNGNFVVAWVSEFQRTNTAVDVFARIFSPSGAGIGNEFPVNTTTVNLCANPSVVGSPDGGFAVAWSQNDNVTRSVASNPFQPTDTTSGNGGTVNFPSAAKSLSSWDVYGRLFDDNGVPIADPIRLNSYTYGDQFAPKLAALPGSYLAVWTSLGQDGSWHGVFGQSLSTTGELVGSEMRVNTTTISRQMFPAVASDGVSRYLTVWTSFGAGTSFDLFAQQYSQSN